MGSNKRRICYLYRPSKREKSLNKSQILRQKLHELEKTPAPSLNKKGIKSKVNCWFNKESPKDIEKNKNKIENYIDMKLVQLNLEINKIDNGFNINSFFEQKEEKMKKFKDSVLENINISKSKAKGRIIKSYNMLGNKNKNIIKNLTNELNNNNNDSIENSNSKKSNNTNNNTNIKRPQSPKYIRNNNKQQNNDENNYSNNNNGEISQNN